MMEEAQREKLIQELPRLVGGILDRNHEIRTFKDFATRLLAALNLRGHWRVWEVFKPHLRDAWNDEVFGRPGAGLEDVGREEARGICADIEALEGRAFDGEAYAKWRGGREKLLTVDDFREMPYDRLVTALEGEVLHLAMRGELNITAIGGEEGTFAVVLPSGVPMRLSFYNTHAFRFEAYLARGKILGGHLDYALGEQVDAILSATEGALDRALAAIKRALGAEG